MRMKPADVTGVAEHQVLCDPLSARRHEVPVEMLGYDFSGVLIVEGLASYDVLECVKGRCVAHILRPARWLTENNCCPNPTAPSSNR